METVLDPFVLQAVALSFVVPPAALAQTRPHPSDTVGFDAVRHGWRGWAIVGRVLLKLLTMRPRREGAGREARFGAQCAEGSWCTPAHAEAPAGT